MTSGALSMWEISTGVSGSNRRKRLAERTASTDTRHLIHVPSNPPGWTAGKWEWYPDVLHPETGELSTQIPKLTGDGWADQHDRIMQSLADMKHRNPIVISGDLYATGVGTMFGSGNRSLPTTRSRGLMWPCQHRWWIPFQRQRCRGSAFSLSGFSAAISTY